jgi:ABC-type transport system involved in cytochrome c biogenesis permease subunit
MATDAQSRGAPRPMRANAATAEFNLAQVTRDALAIVASLRVTVVLFAMAIFMILVVTLAQAHTNMWQATKIYFKPTWGVAWVQVNHLFPTSWLPNATVAQMGRYVALTVLLATPIFTAIAYFMGRKSNLRVFAALITATYGVMTAIFAMYWHGFVFPSGALIGLMLIANLLAAHTIRFKVQAKGNQLVIGLFIIAIGSLLTFLVINAGHNKEGLQQVSFVDDSAFYEQLGIAIKVALSVFAVGVTATAGAFAAKGYAWRIEFWMFAILIFLVDFFAGWVWLAGEDGMLKPEGMRILWDLIKCMFAAVVLLIGSMMLFKRRAGIVVIHAGLLLMMAGEVLVSFMAVETRMQFVEGQVTNFGVDIREAELAFVAPVGDEQEKTVVIPASLLREDETITDDRLPFDVHVKQYMVNTQVNDDNELHTLSQAGPDYENLATKGVGFDKQLIAIEADEYAGADTSRVDVASTYVTLIDKESEQPIGTYLFSVGMQGEDQINVGGSTVTALLRFKHVYKDYIVRLDDTYRKNYQGTGELDKGTVRDYASQIKVVNSRTQETRDKVKIWMNNPFRYAGDTFYQSDHRYAKDKTGALIKDKKGDPIEISTLSVVSNVGWMIPYAACVIVGVGLLAHFIPILIRFLKRERLQGTRSSALVFPIIVVIGALILTIQAARPAKDEGAQIHRFGNLPVMYKGRVKPLDTLARNSLLLLSDKSTFKAVMKPSELKEKWTDVSKKVRKQWSAVSEEDLVAIERDLQELVDLIVRRTGQDDKIIEYQVHAMISTRQPAIVWMLDLIAHAPRALDHKVFRIEHPQVLDLFGLDTRPGLVYSYNELNLKENLTSFEAARKEAYEEFERDKDRISNYHKRVMDFATAIRRFNLLRDTFSTMDPDDADDGPELARMMDKGLRLAEHPVPLMIPRDDDLDSWLPFMTANVTSEVLKSAKKNGDATAGEFAELLAKAELEDQKEKVRESALIRACAMLLSQFNQDRRLTSEQLFEKAEILAKQFQAGQVPEELAVFEAVIERSAQTIEDEFLATLQIELAGMVMSLNGGVALGDPDPAALQFAAMMTAHYEDDAEAFNTALVAYEEALATKESKALQPGDSLAASIVAPTFGSFYQFEGWFNHFDPFFVACGFCVVALVIALLAGLGFTATLNRTAFWLILFMFGLYTLALIGRIYISGRPPVTNLYSSAVFIGWGCVLFGIVLEALFRLGIGNLVAALAGFPTLLISFALAAEGDDTLGVLQAVLDTQFWLATHVVCITLGYAATFLAGTLGLVYIARGLVVPWAAKLCREQLLPAFKGKLSEERYQHWESTFTPDVSPQFARELVRMIYGVLCFAIIFSFIGTVLGGLWADDSWGRFWGWDPKENGALIIVLWNAVVLHARWDGLVRERGLAVLSVVGNIATSWSWFGVNELGVGMHAYGFTEGRLQLLLWFMFSQAVIVGLASLPKKFWWHGSDDSGGAKA